MSSWPRVDPEKRRHLFAEVRRRQNVAWSTLTPTQRVERLDELIELARACANGAPNSDESPETLLRMKAQFRALDAP